MSLKLLGLLSLILFVSILSYSQPQGKVSYLGTINKPLAKNKSSSLNAIDKMIEGSDPVEFELLFHQNTALFKVSPKLDTEEYKNEFLKIMLGGKQNFYTDLASNESFYQIDAYGEYFIVETEKTKWSLSKETKTIGDYLCHKATTVYRVENSSGVFNHKVTAWYTPKIPINIGPKGYHGLPGLILELQVQNKNYVVGKIDLNPEEKVSIIKPTKGKKMTQKEFDELGKKIGAPRKQ